jgi:hypothetical protein
MQQQIARERPARPRHPVVLRRRRAGGEAIDGIHVEEDAAMLGKKAINGHSEGCSCFPSTRLLTDSR